MEARIIFFIWFKRSIFSMNIQIFKTILSEIIDIEKVFCYGIMFANEGVSPRGGD